MSEVFANQSFIKSKLKVTQIIDQLMTCSRLQREKEGRRGKKKRVEGKDKWGEKERREEGERDG